MYVCPLNRDIYIYIYITLHYTYDFVESALLLKQLMYVTIRETF